MKIYILIILFIIIKLIKTENIEFIGGSNGDYMNPYSWNVNRVPGPDDDATINNAYVILEGANNLEMPDSLVVQDNTVFDISASSLLNTINSTASFSDSSLYFSSVRFTSPLESSSLVTFNFVDIQIESDLVFENVKEIEFIDTLLVGNNAVLQGTNSTIKIMGTTNLITNIKVDEGSHLYFDHNSPQDFGSQILNFIDIDGDLTISNSNFNYKVNISIPSNSSNILINGGSHIGISKSLVQFNTASTINIDQGSVISINGYEFKNSINVRGQSNVMFKNSKFYYEPSHHHFSPSTLINFGNSILYLGNSGGVGLGNTILSFYSGAIINIQSLSIQLGVVELQYSTFVTDTFYHNYPIWVTVDSLSVIFGGLDLNLISNVAATIESSLPVLIGYGGSIYGNGKIISDLYVYGQFGQVDKASQINVNGSLILSPDTQFNVRIDSIDSFTKVYVDQLIDFDDATLNIYVNSSVERDVPFTFIKYFDTFENSTLFSQAFVTFDNDEITYSLSCFINNCTIVFKNTNTGSSSEESSSSTSSNGSSSESSSENSSNGNSSEGSTSSNGSTSESSSNGSSSESSNGSTSENSSNGNSSEGSTSSNASSSESSTSSGNGNSSESSTSSNSWSSSSWEPSSSSWESSSSEQSTSSSSSSSWESSSSEDYSIICTFNPISYVLHVVNHAYKSNDEFSIVCTGRGDVKCFNDHFACRTRTNQSIVTCETNKEITCIGLDVKCNILNKFKCETIPPSNDPEVSTPSIPTRTPSITPSTVPTNQSNCDNLIPNSYCWNGQIYCYPPYSGNSCDTINVEIQSNDNNNNNSNYYNNNNNNNSNDNNNNNSQSTLENNNSSSSKSSVISLASVILIIISTSSLLF